MRAPPSGLEGDGPDRTPPAHPARMQPRRDQNRPRLMQGGLIIGQHRMQPVIGAQRDVAGLFRGLDAQMPCRVMAVIGTFIDGADAVMEKALDGPAQGRAAGQVIDEFVMAGGKAIDHRRAGAGRHLAAPGTGAQLHVDHRRQRKAGATERVKLGLDIPGIRHRRPVCPLRQRQRGTVEPVAAVEAVGRHRLRDGQRRRNIGGGLGPPGMQRAQLPAVLPDRPARCGRCRYRAGRVRAVAHAPEQFGLGQRRRQQHGMVRIGLARAAKVMQADDHAALQRHDRRARVAPQRRRVMADHRRRIAGLPRGDAARRGPLALKLGGIEQRGETAPLGIGGHLHRIADDADRIARRGIVGAGRRKVQRRPARSFGKPQQHQIQPVMRPFDRLDIDHLVRAARGLEADTGRATPGRGRCDLGQRIGAAFNAHIRFKHRMQHVARRRHPARIGADPETGGELAPAPLVDLDHPDRGRDPGDQILQSREFLIVKTLGRVGIGQPVTGKKRRRTLRQNDRPHPSRRRKLRGMTGHQGSQMTDFGGVPDHRCHPETYNI